MDWLVNYRTLRERRNAARQFAQHLAKRAQRLARAELKEALGAQQRNGDAPSLGGPTQRREALAKFGTLAGYVPNLKKPSKVNIPKAWKPSEMVSSSVNAVFDEQPRKQRPKVYIGDAQESEF